MDNVKLKYIKSRLEFEKNQLIELLPEELKKQFAWNAYISGGCIYSLYHNQEPKDYDFFLRDEVFAKKLRKFFMEEAAGYHGKGISGGLYEGYPLLITDNAISVGKYQIITKWIGEPVEVVSQFDFNHLMFYYDGNDVDTVSDFECLVSKDLKYNENRARDIVGTVMRTNKFVQRGMNITQKEMAKMLLKLKEVGFSEREVQILDECRQRSDTEHFGS